MSKGNLQLTMHYFRDGNHAIRFIAEAIAKAGGECKAVVAKIVATAFRSDGSVAIVLNETPLTVGQKRNAFGMFQLRHGFATAKYIVAKSFGTLVEIPSTVLEYTGVKQFIRDCGTVLLNSNGDLHLVGSSLYAYSAFISNDGTGYHRIMLPGGIEAQIVRALPVNGSSHIGVAANTNHGNIWTTDLAKPFEKILGGESWQTKMRVLEGATVIRLMRPMDSKLTVVGSDGSIVELEGTNATAARPVLTVGEKSKLDDVIVIPEAFLWNKQADAGTTNIFAGNLTLPVAGGPDVLGYGLYQAHGFNPDALAKAFKSGAGAFA